MELAVNLAAGAAIIFGLGFLISRLEPEAGVVSGPPRWPGSEQEAVEAEVRARTRRLDAIAESEIFYRAV